MSINTLIELLRLRQWVKNLFIIAPLIFCGRFNEPSLWAHLAWVVAAFCLISSGMYIINDLSDLDEDRHHPQKKNRPLASGRMGLRQAKLVAVVLLFAGLGLCFIQGMDVLLLAVSYILLHLLYNLRTKHVVILDVLTVAAGFQIRIWVGAAAIHIMPSAWLQICMFVLALFLGFAKRRCELVNLENSAHLHRSVLGKYTEYFLDQMILVCSTLSIVLYGLYTVSPEVTERIKSYSMFYSTVFVVYGIFRYLYLMHVKRLKEDPSEALLTDKPMMINIILWLFFIVIILKLALR